MRLIAASSGTYYHVEALEGPRYADHFDLVCPPERLDEVLQTGDVLLVPCRMPPPRMIPLAPLVRSHLDAGGTVVAMGESRSDLWLDDVAFTSEPTNWWWWLEPGAKLGVRLAAPTHPLMCGQTDASLAWHLHGWFDPPPQADVLVRDGADRPILYLDESSTNGRLVVTSLDPMYHHGSHFMPATTRFLDAFLPALREWAIANEGSK